MSVSAGQVEIAVGVDGAEAVISQFKQLESMANSLDGRHVKITADQSIRDINRQIAALDRHMFERSKAFEEARKKTKNLTAQINEVGKAYAFAERRMNHWGYSIDKRLGYDVVSKDGKEIGFLSQVVRNPLRVKDYKKRGELLTRRFEGRVNTLRHNINEAAREYPKLETLKKDLELQRSLISPDADVDEFYASVGRYKTERAGLLAARESYQAMSKEYDVQNKLSSSMTTVTDKYKDFQAQLSNMDDASALNAINGKMEQLGKVMDSIKMKRAELGLPTGSEEQDYANRLESKRLGSYLKVFGQEYLELGKGRDALLEYDKAEKQLETDIVRSGSRMQSLGNALQRISSPFMGVLRGVAMGAGYKVLNTAMTGLSSGFARYDTMKMYDKMMDEYSTKTYTTKQSLDDLNKSVLGLPTGLDEIASMAQRYTLSLGDMERGTQLAIATNNAFLASMATDTQKYQGMLQLQDLMNGKELQPREWMSLGSSMGKAINEIAKVMGADTQADIRKFRKELYAGEVDTEKFLDALIKVGTNGGVIEKLAANSKETWQAVIDNISNANSRLVAGLLETLDTVFQVYNGKSFLQNIQELPKAIDKMSASVQSWIRSHPEEITRFFNSLKEIDWGGILSGFAQFGAMAADAVVGIARLAGNKGMVQLMLLTNIAGKIITTWGSFKRGLAGPIARSIMRGGVLAILGSWFQRLKELMPWAKAAQKAAPNVTKGVTALNAVKGSLHKLTGWDVANKAVNFAGIYIVAQALKVMASALQEFNKVKVDVNLLGALSTAGTFVVALAKFAESLGATMALSKEAALATGGGTAVIFGLSKAVEALGNAAGRIGEGLAAGIGAIDKINTMKVPSVNKIGQVFSAIQLMTDAFLTDNSATELGAAITAWAKGLQADNIKKIADAMGSIETLSEINLSENQRKRAVDNFDMIQSFSVDIMKLFDEEEQAQMEMGGGTSRSFKKGSHTLNPTSYSEWKGKVKSFADTIAMLSGAFTNLNTMVTGIKDFNKAYKGLGKKVNGRQEFSWDTFKDRVDNLATVMYEMAGNDESSPFYKLREASQKLKGGDYVKLTEAFTAIPDIMKQVQRIYNRLNKYKVFKDEGNEPSSKTLTKKLQPLFDSLDVIQKNLPEDTSVFEGVSKIKSSLSYVKGVIKKLTEISAMDTSGIHVDTLQQIMDKVNEALDVFRGMEEETIEIKATLEPDIKDNVTPALEQADKDISRAFNAIQRNYSKTLHVRLAARVTGIQAAVDTVKQGLAAAMAQIKNINAGTTKHIGGHVVAHTGGLITPVGPIYRAGGGSVFVPRGTDTIPAMLTPGEYVMRNRAVRTFGIDLMQRLNHLDLHGALNALAVRAGQSIVPRGGVVNNTTNNTKNASVTMNFNHAPAGVGFGRANRFVRSL